MDVNRRTVLAGVGTAAAAGVAGCFGDGEDGDSEGPTLDTEPDYKGWFEGVSNYEGTRDLRGESEVSVEVGVEGGLGYYKFGPPAIAISPDTAVRWEWTGRGGPHNVVALEGTFDSGDPVDRDDEAFEYTFESPAVYRYFCDPHRGQGMKGAVFVALEDSG